MTIEVTQEDIDQGVRGDPRTCMVVRACNRQAPVKDPDGWYAGSSWSFDPIVCLWHYRAQYRWPVPREVVDRMHAFDLGEKVEPFAFDLPDFLALSV